MGLAMEYTGAPLTKMGAARIPHNLMTYKSLGLVRMSCDNIYKNTVR